MFVVNVGGGDFLCAGSYVVQGERYQIVGDRKEARKFTSEQSAINWVEKLLRKRANIDSYEVIEITS